MDFRCRQGQNILEYMVFFCVIVSSLLIMQVYVKRCYQGRIKQEADQLGPQYSPRHTASAALTNTTSISTTYTGGVVAGSGAIVPEGMTLTISDTNTTYTKREAVDSFATEN